VTVLCECVARARGRPPAVYDGGRTQLFAKRLAYVPRILTNLKLANPRDQDWPRNAEERGVENGVFKPHPQGVFDEAAAARSTHPFSLSDGDKVTQRTPIARWEKA
jgi:hypothetical protein